MSIRLSVSVVAATLAFGAASDVTAGNASMSDICADSTTHPVATPPLACQRDVVERVSGLSHEAPVGHRQPRGTDVPQKMESSPLELEQRRLDEELDRKLTICRGC
jgi:hypothetical protein